MNIVISNQIKLQAQSNELKDSAFASKQDKQSLQDRVGSLKQEIGGQFANLEKEEKARETTVKVLESKLGLTAPASMRNGQKIEWLLQELSKRDVKEQIEVLKSIDDKYLEKNAGSSMDKLKEEAERLKKQVLADLKEKKDSGDSLVNDDLEMVQEELSFIDFEDGDNDFLFGDDGRLDSNKRKNTKNIVNE